MDRSNLLTDQPGKFGGTTRAFAVLDRSGSMGNLVSDVIGGYNTWVEDAVAKGDPGSRVTLVIFDSEYDVVYEDRPVTNPDTGEFDRSLLIDKSIYFARGGTDLYNSTNKALQLADKYMKDGDRALFCLATDGAHNVPGEINTPEPIREMIKDREERGNWTFTFLNASPDNFLGRAMGFQDHTTLVIDAADPKSTQAAYRVMTRSTLSYAASPVAAAGAEFYKGQLNEEDNVTTLADVVGQTTGKVTTQ